MKDRASFFGMEYWVQHRANMDIRKMRVLSLLFFWLPDHYIASFYSWGSNPAVRIVYAQLRASFSSSM